MKGIAIIAAAGAGTRAGVDKVWEKIGGKTVLERAAEPFFRSDYISHVIFVVTQKRRKDAEALFSGREKPCFIVQGGETRTESVRNALCVAEKIADGKSAVVAVHDGARPFLSLSLLDRCMAEAAEKGSAVPSFPIADSMRKVENGGNRAVDREQFVSVQTPQCFDLTKLLKSYEGASGASDDATLFEKKFGAPNLVKGEETNKKITYSSDLLSDVEADRIRVGVGYDVHPLAEGRALVLGGVSIPFEKGLLGHSDADCLTHAVMDALLTAASLPDIGHFFPPSDPAYDGANSLRLLKIVLSEVKKKGFRVINVSGMIMAERPKMAPYLSEMEANIAKTLEISEQNVKFGATTTEKLGVVGEGKGMAAEAAALLARD